MGVLGETGIGVGSSLLLASSRCHRTRGVHSAQVSDPEWYAATRFARLPVRLARKLLLLAEAYGEAAPEGLRIDLGLSQQDPGDMTSASRESISMQMRSWRTQRLIEVDAGAIIIRDPDRLKGIVEAS